ncbi:MAG: ABC transporter ATP-binding protein [Bacteroidales bacterium]|nr:ABC transporter ATP-binding protein [Bacteroidales bacterium]
MILSTENLIIGYGKSSSRVAGPFSFRISEGECILLCGANGSGKSTLMKTIAGMIPPIEGTVSEHSGQTVMIPTRIPKVKGFTLEEFIYTGFYAKSSWSGRLGEKEKENAQKAMEELGIIPLRGRDISGLSDGEFQKGCIASAVARMKGSGGGLLLLDEPTAFLDVDSRAGVLDILKNLTGEGRISVIFSSHDIHDSARKADKVFAIREGVFRDSSAEGEAPADTLGWAFDSVKREQ